MIRTLVTVVLAIQFRNIKENISICCVCKLYSVRAGAGSKNAHAKDIEWRMDCSPRSIVSICAYLVFFLSFCLPFSRFSSTSRMPQYTITR